MAFGTVLLLFALTLVVVVIGLAQIGDAEQQVARLDHAKHAGHHAAGLARAQYIHQAHTLLQWNDAHLPHCLEIAEAARNATKHLREQVATQEERTHHELHEMTERPVESAWR